MNINLPIRPDSRVRTTEDGEPGVMEYALVLSVCATVAVLALSYLGQGIALLLHLQP